MPRKSKEQRLAEIHALAMAQFDDSFNATRADRENALMARRFVNIRGAQWDWDEQKQFQNRMRMEIDHISGAVTRIKNEFRKNRVQAVFAPADGSDADDLADACAGRYRADTCDARGREARAMAFDNAVEGGFGGVRLRAEYEYGEHQRICLEPINDAESTLFFDANSRLKDKSDAEHAFLITPWTRKAFVAEYGEECASWPQGLTGNYKFQWFGNGADLVYVAEYFVKEERTDKYRVFKLDGPGEETEEFLADEITETDISELKALGFVEVEGREEEVYRVRKFVMNGAKILEDGQIIPGNQIPLIPQYGHRTVINHVESFRGHVLKSIDPQILFNLQVSKVAETAASSGIEKPIFLEEQIGKYAAMWQNDHIDNNAFMMIESIKDAQGQAMPSGPVGFTKSPDVAPAVAALITLTKQDISDQLGNPENGEQVQPDLSGVAMDMVQGRIDMQSFGYMDNAADAERRIAEVWQAMAAEIYVEKGRKLKTMTEDGKRGSVEIGKMILDKKTGKERPEVDFSRAALDIDVDVGPTSSTRRNAVVRTVTSLIGAVADPETQIILTHVALQNLEGEGMGAIREWSRSKLVQMGVEKPTKEEQAEIDAANSQPTPPDPNTILAGAMAQESQAKAQKAKADTVLAMARTEETRAKTVETLAGIPIAQQDAAVRTAQAIMSESQQQPQPGVIDAGQQ